MQTLTEENYLKALYKLSEASTDEGFVANQALSEHLNVKASSITSMIRQLADKNLLDYERYRGARLNPVGLKMALAIVRKHRLWEVFLVEQLDFKWDEVHEIAEQLEHVQHEELINRLDDLLDNPLFDPHGDPIPNRFGELPRVDKWPLSGLSVGIIARVAGVSDHSEHLLQHIDRIGLRINDSVEISEIALFDQSLFVSINEEPPVFISKQVADHIFVVFNPQ